jgi:hypothetical protein
MGPRVQGSKGPRVQGSKGPRVQGSKGRQVRRVGRSAGPQVRRSAGPQVRRSAGPQVRRSAGSTGRRVGGSAGRQVVGSKGRQVGRSAARPADSAACLTIPRAACASRRGAWTGALRDDRLPARTRRRAHPRSGAAGARKRRTRTVASPAIPHREQLQLVLQDGLPALGATARAMRSASAVRRSAYSASSSSARRCALNGRLNVWSRSTSPQGHSTFTSTSRLDSACRPLAPKDRDHRDPTTRRPDDRTTRRPDDRTTRRPDDPADLSTLRT